MSSSTGDRYKSNSDDLLHRYLLKVRFLRRFRFSAFRSSSLEDEPVASVGLIIVVVSSPESERDSSDSTSEASVVAFGGLNLKMYLVVRVSLGVVASVSGSSVTVVVSTAGVVVLGISLLTVVGISAVVLGASVVVGISSVVVTGIMVVVSISSSFASAISVVVSGGCSVVSFLQAILLVVIMFPLSRSYP